MVSIDGQPGFGYKMTGAGNYPDRVGDAYLRDAYIDQVVAAHRQSDHHAAAGRIWDLMMLELWLQHHVDRRAIAPAVPQAV